MIAYLKGIVKDKENNYLILDVNNVGYKIYVPFFVLEKITAGQTYEFYIYTHVREDLLDLYGFTLKQDKDIYLNLISVSGVGPKTALNIISSSKGYPGITKAIQEADAEFFSNIKGIGKKTGQKIIIELKSKLGSIKELDLTTDIDEDLINALKKFGFTYPEIKKSLKGIDKNLSLEEKIMQALKNQNG